MDKDPDLGGSSVGANVTSWGRRSVSKLETTNLPGARGMAQNCEPRHLALFDSQDGRTPIKTIHE